MKKLLVVSLGVLVAAASFAPAAQAKHRMRKAAPAMAMMVPMRTNAAGEFYATPPQGGDPTSLLLAPLAVPGAVVGGVAEPLLAPIAAPADLPGLDIIPVLTP